MLDCRIKSQQGPSQKKPPGGGFIDKYGAFQRVVEVEVDVEVEVLVEVLLDDPAMMTPATAAVPTATATVVATAPVAAEVAAEAEPAATPMSSANACIAASDATANKNDLTRAFTGILHFPERGYTHMTGVLPAITMSRYPTMPGSGTPLISTSSNIALQQKSCAATKFYVHETSLISSYVTSKMVQLTDRHQEPSAHK